MMIELVKADYDKARPLFETLMSSQMFCAGVIEGLYDGRIFVDNADAPESGIVIKEGWWFLAGNPDNEIFHRGINTALYDQTFTGAKGWGGMLVCHPAGWDTHIPAIYAPRVPIATTRLHYLSRQMNIDWRALIPEGIEIRFIDDSLIDEGIEVHGAVSNVLKLRKNEAEPDLKAVGFVAIHDQRIVASSVIDCIVNKNGDIGLYTDVEFRRRGLAFLTSAATMEYALTHGMEVVHWDCQSFNIGSIRTAEKLGLEFSHEHNMYTLILNPVIHEVNRAWFYFDSGQHPQAIEHCHKFIDDDPEAHPHFHYVLARCHMQNGRPDEAMHWLDRAAKAGWDSVDEIKMDFPALLAHDSWGALVEQVEGNAQGVQE